SAERPSHLTDIARFYAATTAVRTHNSAAGQVAGALGKSLSQNARDFALLNMAIADGLIASMETKFFYDVWRPVTAISAAGTDGNTETVPDSSWLPLIVTPAFPSYPSAHASAGGAARRMLERLYGKTGHAITLTNPAVPGVVLTYSAWDEITDDIDDARVYG